MDVKGNIKTMIGVWLFLPALGIISWILNYNREFIATFWLDYLKFSVLYFILVGGGIYINYRKKK